MDDGYDVPRDEEGLGYPEDGGMLVPMSEGQEQQEATEPLEFDANLAEHLEDSELNKISADLLRGIQQDIDSSAQWRQNLADGIKLLGTIVEPSATDAGTTSTVFEGQHKTTHPLLLEACLSFQANARASLLPAAGPVKVRDDLPQESQERPEDQMSMMGHNGGPPLDDKPDQQNNQPQQGGQPININVQGQQQPQKAYGGAVNGYARGGTPSQRAGDYLPNPYADDMGFGWDRERDPRFKGWPIPSPGEQSQPFRNPYGAPGNGDWSNPNWNAPDQLDDIEEGPPGFIPEQEGAANGGMYADGGSPFGMDNPPGQMAGPMDPMQMGQAPQQPPEPKTRRDLLAQGMETDFNHYLTTTAKEYYPDTDQFLFNLGLSGSGFKKVYNCPIERRPVSESVNLDDMIVSKAFSTLSKMPRITQRIMMRPSTMKRMQLVGAYREIELGKPTEQSQADEVKQVKADVLGVTVTVTEDDDVDYELYECYCELDLDQFAPEKFNGKGLPLPYKVTIAKESQKILEIRRNWKEDDEECCAREYFVDFCYVKAFGIYGLGLIHILGNTTRTLTAAWREFIDSGMFANFPGFVYAKGAGRQLTNNFRVPPGGGIGLDVGLAQINQAVMPLPYKDLGAGFVQFIQHVEEYGQRLGGTANINVGEGRQDAPVGTTLALIEQATKPLGAVLKRLHQSQAKEFQLLKERFKEDPEAFWRFNKKPAMVWQKEQFLQALDDFDLVPVSDPNNPTGLHRLAKAQIVQQMAQAAPSEFNIRKTISYVAKQADINDIEQLYKDNTGPPEPNPEMLAAQAMMADVQQKAQANQQKAQSDMAKLQIQVQDKAAERQSREQTEKMKLEGDKIKLASTLAIHSNTQELEAADRALRLKLDAEKTHADVDLKRSQMHHSHETQKHKTTIDTAAKLHQVNVNAATQHHKTMTDAELKRQQIEQMKQRGQNGTER